MRSPSRTARMPNIARIHTYSASFNRHVDPQLQTICRQALCIDPSVPDSKPEDQTGIVRFFSRLTRVASRIAKLPVIRPTYIGIDFARQYIAQSDSRIDIGE